MRTTLVLAITVGLTVGWIFAGWNQVPLAHSQDTKTAKPAVSTDVEILKASAEQFQTAFNQGDAVAIAAQFAENAEVVDEDGEVVQGRENIQTRFSGIFKNFPKARIAVELTSLRQLSPDVAVEDGFSATTLDPEETGSRSPYTIVHLKRDGKWLMASVRDFPEDETETIAHDELQSLSWLVGQWVDQSGDAKVETTCDWTDDRNYLVQEYVVKVRGNLESRGTQRIGWDPVRKTIRGWVFDQGGGFVESTWTPVDGGWVIKADGYTPQGTSASATRTLTPLGPDLFQLDSTQRLFGQELLPDATVKVARRPPAPVTE
jgi:uncharacterized protein (TIGR02246 family)